MYKTGKRKTGYKTSESLYKYIKECRDQNIKDELIGFIIGWNKLKIKRFMENYIKPD